MNPLPMRMSAISNGPLSHLSRPRSFQSLRHWTCKTWICNSCSQRQSLSAGSKGVQARLDRSTARPHHPQNSTIRTLSTSTKLRDASEHRTDLPSQEEGRRSDVSKRFDHLMDSIQSNIFIAGQRLNDLTGYSGIEALKKDIERQGALLSSPPHAPTHVLNCTLDYRALCPRSP